MENYRTTRFIQIVLVILFILLVLGAVFYIGSTIFTPSKNTTPSDNSSQTALLSTSADRSVRLTVRGEIVADENFRSYQIQITPNARVLTEYQSYLNVQFDNITLSNTIPSYEQFVYALDKAGMMTGTEFSGASNDLRGVCATGRLYEFEILKANKTVKKLWTSGCSSSRGSLRASRSELVNLFINQIPGAHSKISRLW